MDDALLLNRAIAGDLDSLGQLFDSYFGRIYDFAWRMLRDADAAGAATEAVFRETAANLRSAAKASSFEAWLFSEYWTQWSPPQHIFHFTKQTMARLLTMTGFHPLNIKDGLGTSFFLGSVDSVLKDRLQTKIRCGKLMKVLVAKPLCLLIGLLGYGSEMKVYAEKAAT